MLTHGVPRVWEGISTAILRRMTRFLRLGARSAIVGAPSAESAASARRPVVRCVLSAPAGALVKALLLALLLQLPRAAAAAAL